MIICFPSEVLRGIEGKFGRDFEGLILQISNPLNFFSRKTIIPRRLRVNVNI